MKGRFNLKEVVVHVLTTALLGTSPEGFIDNFGFIGECFSFSIYSDWKVLLAIVILNGICVCLLEFAKHPFRPFWLSVSVREIRAYPSRFAFICELVSFNILITCHRDIIFPGSVYLVFCMLLVP